MDISTTKVVAIAKGLKPNETQAIISKGYDFCITNPADISETTKIINHAIAII